MVAPGSEKTFSFNCVRCGHTDEYTAKAVTKRSRGVQSDSCRYCVKTNYKICLEDCTFCRSFASHPCHVFWDPANPVTPREVKLRSNTAYSFICADGQSFA